MDKRHRLESVIYTSVVRQVNILLVILFRVPIYTVPGKFGTVPKCVRFRHVNRQNHAKFGRVNCKQAEPCDSINYKP